MDSDDDEDDGEEDEEEVTVQDVLFISLDFTWLLCCSTDLAKYNVQIHKTKNTQIQNTNTQIQNPQDCMLL